MVTRRTACALALLAFGLAACGDVDATNVGPALSFALAYEPVSTDEVPVPSLPVPGPEAAAAFAKRPVTPAARRAAAIVGTRLWRFHADHFAQAYELRQDESNPILDVLAEVAGIDLAEPEFLPSSIIHDWARTQRDLASDPLVQAETVRIEEALARDR